MTEGQTFCDVGADVWPRNPLLSRPFRAHMISESEPRTLPWAGIGRALGASEWKAWIGVHDRGTGLLSWTFCHEMHFPRTQ